MEINREKRLLQRVAQYIADMDWQDMTVAEVRIADLLVDELYLLKEETSHNGVREVTYKVVR